MLKEKEEWNNVKLVHLITAGAWTRSLVGDTNSTSYSVILQGNPPNILKAKENVNFMHLWSIKKPQN